jgi:UDP-N-acetylmuramate dehydrogenase
LIENSLTGFEFAGGLPGSIGGAAYMNARCYGSEMSKVVKSINYIDNDLNESTISIEEINYTYKNSIFMKNPEWYIISVELELTAGDQAEIKELTEKNFEDRKSKGQFDYPSAGCVFKNNYDVGIPSGQLIDELSLKGSKVGGAQVYENHANFIINKSNAKGSDVITLLKMIEKEVYSQRGIRLEREIQVL